VIVDPFLSRVVRGHARKTCQPDVMDLAREGRASMKPVLAQAIRAACPTRPRKETSVGHLSLICRLATTDSW
jgi:hypothetical protein